MGNAAASGELAAERAEVDLLRRRVINVVGHELRTPITTLRGLAELLGTEHDPAAQAELHGAIVRIARRAEALLDDLLVATSVNTALPVGEQAPVPVAELVHDAWAQLATLGELRVDGDATAVARPGVVRRAVSALLENASRYGEPPVSVTITEAGGNAVIVVADRGPGVPSAELPLLTEPFFRGERAVLTHHSLGLGLAVVRALADQHDGHVDVRNREDGGFEVELRLPAAR